MLINVAEGIVPIEIVRVLVSSSGSRCSSRGTICGARRCIITIIKIVHIAIIALNLIVDIVVGAATRAERTGIFIAFATIARKKVLPRVTSEVVPVVVGAHPRQHLIV